MTQIALIALLILLPLALAAGAWEQRQYNRRQAMEAAKRRHPAHINAMRRRERGE